MLEAFFLNAALALGQTDNNAVEILRAEAPAAQAPAPTPAAPSSRLGRPELYRGMHPDELPPADAVAQARPPAEPPPTAGGTPTPKHPSPPEPVTIEAPTLPPPVTPTPPAASPAPTAPPDRWALMKALQGTWIGDGLQGNRMQIYGWTEGSYTLGSNGRGAWPMLAQSPTDEFLMNQNWLVFERTVVTSGTTEPTFGFHTAWILPGTDARYTPSRHLLDEQHGVGVFDHSAYPIDLFHAYLEAYFPTVGRGLDIKIGKNAVPYFAETEDQVFNPLYSHTYIFYYGGPFTHTGIQANLKLTDEWSVEARLVVGSDIFFGPGDEPTFVGAVQWTQPGGGRNTALLSVVLGPGRFDVRHSQNNLNLIDLVYTHTFNPVLKYTLDTTAGYETNNPDPVNGTATWYGMAHYLTYSITPRLSATGRVELFEDGQGLRTGFKGLYEEATLGVTFKPRRLPSNSPVIFIRPELRYDYNDESRPFQNHHGLATAATDFIVRW